MTTAGEPWLLDVEDVVGTLDRQHRLAMNF